MIMFDCVQPLGIPTPIDKADLNGVRALIKENN